MGLFIKQTGSGFSFSAPADEPLLIIGLGNVGDKYTTSRHNIGFKVLDEFANELGCTFKDKKDLDCEIAEGKVDGVTLILVKPTTMMNLSGRAAQKVTHFYKLRQERVIVIHDELDLEFGDIRKKSGGGSAGHNGIKSVATTIGPDFNRIRIGIGSDRDPRFEASDFVLGNFTKEEIKALTTEIIPESIEQLKSTVSAIK